jgi:hypothetical protein
MDGLQPEQLRTLFRWFKEGPPGALPIEQDGRSVGLLQSAHWEDAGSPAVLQRLATWQGISPVGARQWLIDEVLQAPDAVLFWVRDLVGQVVGQVGLSLEGQSAGMATLVQYQCGVAGAEALMACAVGALEGWARHALRLQVQGPVELHRVAA